MTYSELLNYLKTLAENAPLVHTVTKGDVSKLDLDKANVYPLVHLDIAGGGLNKNQVTLYNISIAVLQQRDFNNEVVEDKFWRQDNEVDNHNETMLILQFMWAQIFNDWQGNYVSSNETPTFEKIAYSKGNVLDGWELTFEVEVPFSIDICIANLNNLNADLNFTL